MSFLLCKSTGSFGLSATSATLAYCDLHLRASHVWPGARLQKSRSHLPGEHCHWSQTWVELEPSYLCWAPKGESRKGASSSALPANKLPACHRDFALGSPSSTLLESLGSLAGSWCFGEIWITPEADGLLTSAAVIKPSWRKNTSGQQGQALKRPVVLFLIMFFFFLSLLFCFQRPCLSFLQKKKSWNNMNNGNELG